jgi:hypothetical protein
MTEINRRFNIDVDENRSNILVDMLDIDFDNDDLLFDFFVDVFLPRRIKRKEVMVVLVMKILDLNKILR